jgi:hypothetical protein
VATRQRVLWDFKETAKAGRKTEMIGRYVEFGVEALEKFYVAFKRVVVFQGRHFLSGTRVRASLFQAFFGGAKVLF